ncbi:unnamed protein product [Polarella glacialis]|uniref:EF-hand domain-containing protein n=1 Tax=Polarella glacialis TaxID=89957 RepID=A0A813DD70_POLGL|nr:unnamed protein product [Polarella glacialis]CAE8604608.1 unnamed protein product [Polarella glacialis]
MATKEFPRCTVFLFVAALTCHTLVLIGNLATAEMLTGLGKSAEGWSDIGSGISYAMTHELSPAMQKVSQSLAGALDKASQVEKGMDNMLSLTGSATDSALQHYDGSQTGAVEFKANLLSFIQTVADKSMAKMSELVSQLLEMLRPALEQIKEWLGSFGENIQESMSEFATTVDRVQKIFDQVTAKLSSKVGSNEKEMLSNTYDLFDTDNSGTIREDDLASAAKIYGITSLTGGKAKQIFAKYDQDHAGGITREEYALFVHDPTMPGIMTVVLRTYAKKLATIAGRVGLARMRDEVADAVVDYIGLTCVKNLGKVKLVTDRLASSSIPLEFLADVLVQLVMNMDDPTDLTVIDVGQLVVNYTLSSNAPRVAEAVQLLSKPDFWESEGFSGPDQARSLKQIVQWVVNVPGGAEALHNGLSMSPSVAESLPEAVFRLTQATQEAYAAQHRSSKAEQLLSQYKSNASLTLRKLLLGGVAAAARGFDPDAVAAIGKGQPAKPETLAFAQELAANASQTALVRAQECFTYSATSSGALEGVANSMDGMIKKTTNFLELMKKYASREGIDRLETEALQFGNRSVADVLRVSEKYVDSQMDFLRCSNGDNKACARSRDDTDDLSLELSGASTFLTSTLADLKGALPVVIDNLKTAHKEVNKFSGTLDTVMQVLGVQAPPLFTQVAGSYQTIWVLYFAFFFLFTSSMCFYGFWAAGYFGGPQPGSSEDGFEPPHTFVERLRTCGSSCLSCLRGCSSGHFCMWSVLLLTQVIVLLLFLISLTVCLVTGVQAFVSAGCSQIFILGDETVCTTALTTVKFFLKTFGLGDDIGMTCHTKRLMTCGIIRDEMKHSIPFVVVGSMLASTFSFEMLLDSAVKHERARCMRLLEAEAKTS